MASATPSNVNVHPHTLARLIELGIRVPGHILGHGIEKAGDLIGWAGDKLGPAEAQAAETNLDFQGVGQNDPRHVPQGFEFREDAGKLGDQRKGPMPMNNRTSAFQRTQQTGVPQQKPQPQQQGFTDKVDDFMGGVGQGMRDFVGSGLGRGNIYGLVRGVFDPKWVDENDKLSRDMYKRRYIMQAVGMSGIDGLMKDYAVIQRRTDIPNHQKRMWARGAKARIAQAQINAHMYGVKDFDMRMFYDELDKYDSYLSDAMKDRGNRLQESNLGFFTAMPMNEKPAGRSAVQVSGIHNGEITWFAYWKQSEKYLPQAVSRGELPEGASEKEGRVYMDPSQLEREPNDPHAGLESLTSEHIRPVSGRERADTGITPVNYTPVQVDVRDNADEVANIRDAHNHAADALEQAYGMDGTTHQIAQRIHMEEDRLDQKIASIRNNIDPTQLPGSEGEANKEIEPLLHERQNLAKKAIANIRAGNVIDEEATSAGDGIIWKSGVNMDPKDGDIQERQARSGMWQNSITYHTYGQNGELISFQMNRGDPYWNPLHMSDHQKTRDKGDEMAKRKEMLKHEMQAYDAFNRAFGDQRRDGWPDLLVRFRQQALFEPVTDWFTGGRILTPNGFNLMEWSQFIGQLRGQKQTYTQRLDNLLRSKLTDESYQQLMDHPDAQSFLQPPTEAEIHAMNAYQQMFLKLREMVDEQRFSNDDARRAMAALGDPSSLSPVLIMRRMLYAINDSIDIQWRTMNRLRKEGYGETHGQSLYFQEAYHVPTQMIPLYGVELRGEHDAELGIAPLIDEPLPLGMDEATRDQIYAKEENFDPYYQADIEGRNQYTINGQQYRRLWGSFLQRSDYHELMAKDYHTPEDVEALLLEQYQRISPYARDMDNYRMGAERMPEYRDIEEALAKKKERI